ncbi:MAG: hypothetical protein JHC26_13070 [Thermofilum sp.]|jgi:hypothetical protein|uniref:hypothetical protein n=1 Tax=Thermofilum sp. TaxID=1961369 RepID=UPI0025840716|nr:hypothetical protein [Thermofilum sp.]MCI4410016.1 hypothetical protein [Thermofilum sp.]
MSNIVENSEFASYVKRIQTYDYFLGGQNGINNSPIQNLADRTKFLYDKINEISVIQNSVLTDAVNLCQEIQEIFDKRSSS